MHHFTGSHEHAGRGRRKLRIDGKVVHLVTNEAYMVYRDYLYVDNYFREIEVSLVQELLFLRRQGNQQGPEADVLCQLVLVAAKASYLQQNYTETLRLLAKLLPLDLKLQASSFSFKVLYQRQLLVLKTLYFLAIQQSAMVTSIQEAYLLYDQNKYRCKDWDQIEGNCQIYDENVSSVYQAVKVGSKSRRTSQKVFESRVYRQAKQELIKQTIILQGLPLFLLSRRWLNQALHYLSSKQLDPSKVVPFPGPPTNLDLINHIFQFEPQPQVSRAYTDTLLFPLTEHIDYTVVNRSTWNDIVKNFGPGITIMRYAIRDNLFTEEGETDTLQRMVIECGGLVCVLQWQAGLLYERSLLPTLNRHFFGEGQLKQLSTGTNRRGDQYKVEKVVRAGRVMQHRDRFKFVQFGESVISALPPDKLNILKISNNLEQYDADLEDQQQTISLMHDSSLMRAAPKIGMNVQQLLKLLSEAIPQQEKDSYLFKNHKKWLSTYLECIGSVLSLIGSVVQVASFFSTNRFVAALSQSALKKVEKGEPALFIMEFNEFIKDMYWSVAQCDQVQCNSIIECVFVNILRKLSYKYEKLKNRQTSYSFSDYIQKVAPVYVSPSALFHTFVAQLHEATDQAQSPQQAINHTYMVKHLNTIDIRNYLRVETTLAAELFTCYGYQIEQCGECGRTGDECRLRATHAVDVQLSASQMELTAYFVYPVGYAGQGEEPIDKKVDESTREIYSERPNFAKWMTPKVVEKITLKLAPSDTLAQVYSLISTQYGLSAPSESEHRLVSVILDENMDEFTEICPQGQGDNQNKPITSVSQILSLLNRIKKGVKNFLYIFRLQAPKLKTQVFALASFRNPTNDSNKGYPTILKVNMRELAESKDGGKDYITSTVLNSSIEVSRLKMTEQPLLKTGRERLVEMFIKIYTPSKIGGWHRTTLGHILTKPHASSAISLQASLESQYVQSSSLYWHDQSNDKPKPSINCSYCGSSNLAIHRRLIQLPKMLAFCIRSGAPSRFVYPVYNLNMRPFLSSKHQTTKLLYNLHACIVSRVQGSNEKYILVFKNPATGEWWRHDHEGAAVADIQDYTGPETGYRVHLLLYEKVAKKREGESGTAVNLA